MNEGRQGEQNETGAGTRNLNDVLAYAWAAVSGTVWKGHALAPGSVLTAEYARGPLILWAKTPGEGEAVAPALPSDLEDRIDRLNTAQVFKRFMWAAQGKVRHSVRWKSPAKNRRTISFLSLIHIAVITRFIGFETSGRWTNYTKGYIKRQAMTSFSRKTLIEYVNDYIYLENEDSIDPFEGHYNNFRKKPKGMSRFGIIHPNTIEEKVFFHFCDLYDEKPPGYLFEAELKVYGGRFLSFLSDCGANNINLESIFRKYTQKKGERFSALLKSLALEKAFRRAHLTRRVKPAPRRHRIRRPLYARPQPPAAPLAPPV